MKKINKLVIIIAVAVCATVGLALGLIFGREKEVLLLKAELVSATVYEGNELDLTGGILQYQIEDEKSQISLTSPDVSISGFNKNIQGEQTLTIEYKGKEITLVVTVLPRVAVESAQTVYFVGEDFNNEKGTVKVVLANGSTISVPLSDSKISVEGFNSASETSALTLTVTYTDGDFSYGNTMKVRVVEPEISLKKPNDCDYMSHETELKYNGGYLKVKVDGKTEYVDLTSAGVSVEGYNPEALTVANYGKPVTQTITVTYKNREFTFPVTVTYSEVSLVRHYASELASLDWTGDTAPVITKEQGENALKAVEAYLSLDDEDKALITNKEKKTIVLPAAVYGYEEWKTEAIAYQNTFVISGNTVILTCESYDTTKTDAGKLGDTSARIYTLGDVLATIATEFAEEEIFEKKISEYLGAVYSAEALSNCKSVLDYMVTLYDALKDVPANWETLGTDLTQYASGFNTALEAIKGSAYKSYDSRFIYGLVSNWREKNDYAELLYTYFYGKNDSEAIAKLKDVILPGKVNELYVTIRDAINQTSYMGNAMQVGYIVDTTEFMVLFTNAQELMTELGNLADGNMYKELYKTLKFDGILYRGGQPISVSFTELYDFVRTTSYGFVDLLHTMYESNLYERLWRPYLAIVTSTEEGYFESNDYKQDVEELFRAFVEATPTEQYSFLDSLNIFYRYNHSLQTPILALSAENGYVYSVFSKIINEYYDETLDEETYVVYEKLVKAMEYYVVRFKFADAYESFVDNILEAKAEYEALDPEKKLAFNNNVNLKFFYDKYVGYYEQETKFATLDATWAAKFDELKQAYLNAYDAYVLIMNDKAPTNAYALFFSAYKKSVEISNYILTNASAEVKTVYYYQGMPLADGFLTYSMDSWALEFRTMYAGFMMDIRLNTTSGGSRTLWDFYLTETYNLDEFFLSLYEILVAYKNEDFSGVTTQEVADVMQGYNALSLEKKIIFSYFEEYYVNALRAYVDQAFTATACKSLFNDLLTAQEKYLAYLLHVSNTEADKIKPQYESEFKTAAKKVIDGYADLSEAQKQEFGAIKSVCDFYEAEYNKLA